MSEVIRVSDRLGPANDVDTLRDERAALRRVAESRAVIEQAKGMLMERVGCTADDAFAILVESSQRGNRKLRDIAAEQVCIASGAPAGGDHQSGQRTRWMSDRAGR